MDEKLAFSRNKLLSSLMQIPHGDLIKFIGPALPAAKTDPDMFGHLIAWNHKHGKVFDSKVAFPVIGLRGLTREDRKFAENCVAHMVSLGPRELVRAYKFSHHLTKMGNYIPGGHRRMIEQAIKKYLEVREENTKWFDRSVLSHRQAMLYLYKVSHKKPSERAQKVLFDRCFDRGSVFDIVKGLRGKSQLEAAGLIRRYKIPFQIAVGSVAKAKDPDIIMAVIDTMTGNELINSTSMLKKFGVFDTPSLKAAYDAAVERSKKDKRVNVYKASKAAEHLDENTAKKVKTIQKAQEQTIAAIDGNVLVAADASQSMEEAVEKAKMVAAVIASRVKGKVWLVFFNVQPRPFDVTGKSYDEIMSMTKGIRAHSRTSIGCPLAYIMNKDEEVNCIVIVSDGCDNEPPFFNEAYLRYVRKFNFEPTVYLLHVPGAPNVLPDYCRQSGIQIEERELDENVDYYSLPNIIQGIKTTRFALLDEVMETELLTFDNVFISYMKGGERKYVY